ncbi:MAG: hypothetical protein WDN28_21260 [Chthoniobacter sp.]
MGAAPPQPVELNIKVRREGKTEIPLRIYGKANEPLKYLIRVPPVHGRLSEPRPTEREVSVVVYEPPADLGITTDKFSYAVQSAVGVSASVEISMTIVDQPPQLTIQDALDFSTVRTGASNFRMLEISNHGGLIAAGDVIVNDPWKIEGKAATACARATSRSSRSSFRRASGESSRASRASLPSGAQHHLARCFRVGHYRRARAMGPAADSR